MAALSHYLSKKILDHVLGQTAFDVASVPDTVYIRLYTATPGPTGGGGTEVSTVGTDYAALAVLNNTTNWPVVVLGTNDKFLNVAHEWAAAAANWGTVVGMAIWDASTGGNMLFYGDLTSSIAIGTGDIFRFPAGTGGLNIDLS